MSARFMRCILYLNNALQFFNITWLHCIKVKRRRSFRWISKLQYLMKSSPNRTAYSGASRNFKTARGDEQSPYLLSFWVSWRASFQEKITNTVMDRRHSLHLFNSLLYNQVLITIKKWIYNSYKLQYNKKINLFPVCWELLI